MDVMDIQATNFNTERCYPYPEKPVGDKSNLNVSGERIMALCSSRVQRWTTTDKVLQIWALPNIILITYPSSHHEVKESTVTVSNEYVDRVFTLACSCYRET